jgi:SAM-dependent methyltransferase
MKECIKCGNVFSNTGWQCSACLFQPVMRQGIPVFAPDQAEESAGFKAGYFDQLYVLEEANFWFRARNRLILWALNTYCPPFESFLEIGCGTGYVLAAVEKAFPDTRLSGSEVYSVGLSYAVQRGSRCSFLQMDARKIPFRAEFDVIGVFDVLEHIDDDETALREMHKALKPGGFALITVPQHKFLWSHLDDYSKHVRRYSRTGLREMADRCGFTVVRMTSFVSVLLPLLALSRARVPADCSSFDPVRELRISGWKNRILESLLTAEQQLIRLGFDFPAGGSLLMVAKKTSGVK